MTTCKKYTFVFLIASMIVLIVTGVFLLSSKQEPDAINTLNTNVEVSEQEEIQVKKADRLHVASKKDLNPQDRVDQNAIATVSKSELQNSKKNDLLSFEKETVLQDKSPEIKQTAQSISLDDIPDSPLKADLVKLDDKSLEFALRTLSSLGKQAVHNDILSLNVDSSGGIFYTCTFNPSEGAVLLEEDELEEIINKAGEPQGTPVPISSPPVRHSKPGASNVLYLDFNGGVVSGTAWNVSASVTSWDCKPYDLDNDEITFSDSEQAKIIMFWEFVAEDYEGCFFRC